MGFLGFGRPRDRGLERQRQALEKLAVTLMTKQGLAGPPGQK